MESSPRKAMQPQSIIFIFGIVFFTCSDASEAVVDNLKHKLSSVDISKYTDEYPNYNYNNYNYGYKHQETKMNTGR